ncbi:MAG: ABC transporter substrate-binding protein [Clostridiales bacterium]|nr:ABC transporter substrate-binding protein [Clostridiales bacterium]
MKKVLAMLLTLCLVIGLGGTFTLAEEAPVTIRWATVGSGMPANYDAWKAKMDEYLGEKIGVNIEMEVVSWGDWENRRNVIINTNEPFDIIFGNSDVYTADALLGSYLDIGDMLATAAPELQAMIPASYWDACRINGKIYAVPTYKDSSQTEYIVWDKDLLDRLEIDASEATTFEAMTPILTKIVEDTNSAAFLLSQSGATYLNYQYDSMSCGLSAVGVRFNDTEGKVVPVFEQEDIMAYLTQFHEWYNAGIINSDAATLPEDNKYKPCSMAQGWPSAALTTWGPNMGVNAVAYQWENTIVSNDTVRGSLNSVSVNSEHPEKALALLELINTDAYVRDSFYYGLEGADWDYTDAGTIHRNTYDWTMAGYTQGTFFEVTPTDDVDFNQWDEVKALNEQAQPSVLLGFTFDTAAVADQIANCTEIFNRYKGELLTGTVDPADAVPAMMAEMRDGGFDEIVTAAQAQVDVFMAAK